MKSYPTQLGHGTGGRLLAAAFLTLVSFPVPSTIAADDEFIHPPTALQKLHELALAGKSARVVLEDMKGGQGVVFARVGFYRFNTSKGVAFGPHFTRRPQAERSLLEEYLDRPLTNSPEDRELAEKTVLRVERLELSGNVMEDGYNRYRVRSIDELDMRGPRMPVAMTVRAKELPPDDPWIGDKQREPSNWEVRYTIKGLSEEFRFRIPFLDHPGRAPIDSVTVHPATWWYERSQGFVWGIPFEVREGVHRPFRGYFLLDDYGYPYAADFPGGPVPKELSAVMEPTRRWVLCVTNHEFESPREAWDAYPNKIGNRSELGQILYDLLKSTQNPDIRHQVLYAIQASRIYEKRLKPLIQSSLDSPYEEEVATAKSILERFSLEEARLRARGY